MAQAFQVSEDATRLDALGAFVRDRRQSLNLTQTQLAERLGWVQERISVLEHGKYGMPSLPALARLAAALETSLYSILGSAGFDENFASTHQANGHDNSRALLYTLQRLLTIDALQLKDALDQASNLLAEVMSCDKIDAFIYEPASESLVATGSSNTPMGIRQRQIGMDRVPLANRTREVEVYSTGEAYRTGRADTDPGISAGVTEGLGVRSMLMVPLEVGGSRRGVLAAETSQVDQFSEEDLAFFETIARWVGTVAHRAELSEAVASAAAEAARRVRGEELLTLLAHELGNHITPLQGRVDVILRRAERENRDDFLKDAREASRALGRVRQLIQELLDSNRLEQGIFSISNGSVDLVELVLEVAREQGNARTPFHMRLPERLDVLGDVGRLCQILENLFSNAIRYSPAKAPIVLELSAEKGEQGEWAVLTVHDDGPGVAPDVLPALFERFSASEGSSGLGLGLYLARGIAEAHGGSLTVDTSAKQGSTFTLRLPVGDRP